MSKKEEFISFGSNAVRKDKILHIGIKSDGEDKTVTLALIDRTACLDICFSSPSLARFWIGYIIKELKS